MKLGKTYKHLNRRGGYVHIEKNLSSDDIFMKEVILSLSHNSDYSFVSSLEMSDSVKISSSHNYPVTEFKIKKENFPASVTVRYTSLPYEVFGPVILIEYILKSKSQGDKNAEIELVFGQNRRDIVADAADDDEKTILSITKAGEYSFEKGYREAAFLIPKSDDINICISDKRRLSISVSFMLEAGEKKKLCVLCALKRDKVMIDENVFSRYESESAEAKEFAKRAFEALKSQSCKHNLHGDYTYMRFYESFGFKAKNIFSKESFILLDKSASLFGLCGAYEIEDEKEYFLQIADRFFQKGILCNFILKDEKTVIEEFDSIDLYLSFISEILRIYNNTADGYFLERMQRCAEYAYARAKEADTENCGVIEGVQKSVFGIKSNKANFYTTGLYILAGECINMIYAILNVPCENNIITDGREYAERNFFDGDKFLAETDDINKLSPYVFLLSDNCGVECFNEFYKKSVKKNCKKIDL